MQILNIAGYKFIALSYDLNALRNHLVTKCGELELKGTILLSSEGINLSLAGSLPNTMSFMSHLKTDLRFADIRFHETFSETIPFNTLKVKLKKEIITLNKSEVNAVQMRAPSLTPEDFKQWLDEKRDLTLLDTRNDYEVRFGTFTGAKNLHLNDFGEFPEALADVDKDKPIVMFCTGGIRCEKAALYMLHHGYSHIYQLDGGILGYFAKVGGAHYTGECFVFDERVALDTHLNDTGTIQCPACQGPVTKAQQQCPACTQN